MTSEMPETGVGGISSRGASPIHYSLLDEDQQAVLPVDTGTGSQPPLTLEIKNRSGRDVIFQASNHGVPSLHFHHIGLAFRVGVLSKNTLEKLPPIDASVEVLAAVAKQFFSEADAKHWRISGVPFEGESQFLLLVYCEKDPLTLPAGGKLKIHLRNVVASQETRHGLIKVGLWLDKADFAAVGNIGSASTLRHCRVMVQSTGSIALPLNIGFDGKATIRGDGQPDTLIVAVYNRSKAAVGTAGAAGRPASLRLSFDPDGPWAKPYQTPPEISATLGEVQHDTSGEGDIPHTWKILLPKTGIPPKGSLKVTIDKIAASKEGIFNVYLDATDIPSFRSQVILPVTASLQQKQLTSLKDKVDSQLATLSNLDGRLADLKLQIADLTKDLEQRLASFDSVRRIASAADWVCTSDAASDSVCVKGYLDELYPSQFKIEGQHWTCLEESGKKVTARDVSRRYVLMDENGTVRPVFNGVLGPALPLPPPTYGTFGRIGELHGYPLLISSRGDPLCWHGEWIALMFPYPYIRSVADSWVLVDDSSSKTLKAAKIRAARKDDSVILAAPDFYPPYPPDFSALGGTEHKPLVVTRQGQILLSKADKWDPVTDAAKSIVAVNAGGVVLAGPSANVDNAGPLGKTNWKVFRYQYTTNRTFAWVDLDDGRGCRIGGTWRNPIVVNHAGYLYRLEP